MEERIPEEAVPEQDYMIDVSYEMEQVELAMQSATEEGHFLGRQWLFQGQDLRAEVRLSSPERPLDVHTYLRGNNRQSFAHNRHPFVAALYLLREADGGSAVYISAPFLTDTYFVDELCHYAKPIEDGGRSLQVHLLLGPAVFNETVISRFIGTSQVRFESISRLSLRRYGIDNPVQNSAYMHTKVLISTAGTMIGSYNYTFASRFRHREDGIVIENGSMADRYRERFRDVWNISTVYTPRRPPDEPNDEYSKEPGFVPEAKRAKYS